MKTKIISLLMALGIVGVLQVQAQISWINNTSGTISISQSQYVNNMNQSWYINASSSSYEFLQITVQSVETERNYDFLSIFSVDNNGNILSTEMIASGAVGTIRIIPSVPTKRFMVRFKSDSSNNGSSPGYGGFTLSYLTTNSSATVDSYVSGNAYVSGSLQTTSLLVSGYSSFSGPSTYFNSNYNYFSGVNYINGDSYLSKVGIGTSSLLKQLNVGGDSYFDGNVGIKTSDPKVTLDVNGSVYLPSGNSYWLGSYSNSGNRLRMHHNGTDAYIDYQPNLYLRSGTTTRMTLLSNGNVGIGINPTQKLEVAGTIKANAFMGTAEGGALKIQTSHGFLEIGPRNTGWAHIQTDRSKFYFNKPIYLENGQLSSYNTANLSLQTNGTNRITVLNSNGNVGIGTTDPQTTLEVNGDLLLGAKRGNYDIPPGYASKIEFNQENMDNIWISRYNKEYDYSELRINIGDDGGIGDRFSVGFTHHTRGDWNEAFAVLANGTVLAKEVKIVVDTGADFVFSPDYRLKSLPEVESFIRENNHLPEIPSEKAMQEDGLSINEFQIKLLQKIEELTLYVIEQNKAIENLQRKNEELEHKISK